MLKRIPARLMVIILVWMLTACGNPEAGREISLERQGEILPEGSSGKDPQVLPVSQMSVLGREPDEIGGGEPDEDMIRYLWQVSVQIRGSKYLGSGVIWDASEYSVIVATAAHVAEDNTPLTVQFNQGLPMEVRLSHIFEQVDVAFLEVSLQEVETQGIIWQRARQDKEVCDQLDPGQSLWIMGSVEEAADRTYSGSVTEPWIYLDDFENYMLLGHAYAIPGVSGGGVFTRDGVLVGILCGGNEEDQIAVLPWCVMDANSP